MSEVELSDNEQESIHLDEQIEKESNSIGIVLASKMQEYFGGDAVEGYIQLNIQKPANLDALSVTLIGEEVLSLEDELSGKNIFIKKVVALEIEPVTEQHEAKLLQKGAHRIPFSIILPSLLPPSFEAERKSVVIHYKLVSDLLTLEGDRLDTSIPLTVAGSLFDSDAIKNANSGELSVSDRKDIAPGHVSASVRLDSKIYTPGSFINALINVTNDSRERVEGVSAKLIQTIQISYNGHVLYEEAKDLAFASVGAIIPQEYVETNRVLQVPTVVTESIFNRIVDSSIYAKYVTVRFCVSVRVDLNNDDGFEFVIPIYIIKEREMFVESVQQDDETGTSSPELAEPVESKEENVDEKATNALYNGEGFCSEELFSDQVKGTDCVSASYSQQERSREAGVVAPSFQRRQIRGSASSSTGIVHHPTQSPLFPADKHCVGRSLTPLQSVQVAPNLSLTRNIQRFKLAPSSPVRFAQAPELSTHFTREPNSPANKEFLNRSVKYATPRYFATAEVPRYNFEENTNLIRGIQDHRQEREDIVLRSISNKIEETRTTLDFINEVLYGHGATVTQIPTYTKTEYSTSPYEPRKTHEDFSPVSVENATPIALPENEESIERNAGTEISDGSEEQAPRNCFEYENVFSKDLPSPKKATPQKRSGELRIFGGVYNGEHSDGIPHGHGVMLYSNGSKYTGTWVNGKKDGSGKLQYSDGAAYEGEWKSDERHGWGFYSTFTYKYDGHWQKDMKHGRGLIVYNNREQYEGEWSSNYPSGIGIYTFKDGSTYRGCFKNGLRHGKGVLQYKDGSMTYEGDFVNDRKHGRARIIFNNGVYEGELRNDAREGFGIYRYSNGDSYEGTWVNNKKHGYGLLNYASGGYFKGVWVNGEKHGNGELVHANLRYAERWVKGSLVAKNKIPS